jgi:DNA-binding transcriptional MerR regulator/effector-binding domain-containing protein
MMIMALLTIGDFSRMTHLSVKALRHYHDMGVLEPAVIDPFTGYRSYDTGQVPAAQVIRRLRDLNMPLDQIRAVLGAPDVDVRSQEIMAHLSRMERQLQQTQAAVAGLRALLAGPAARPAVEVRAIPAVTALAVRDTVTAADAPVWGLDAFGSLTAALSSAGLTAAGCPGALFPSEFFETERGELTLFLPVVPAVASAPAGRVQLMEVPAAEVAVMTHEGAADDIDRTYGALGTAVAERAIGVDGPIREYYLVSVVDTDDEREHRTEVCWPVFRTAA